MATIPLVCALAGNGTWLAYVLATVAILLVALCVGVRALLRSPGSLYPYAIMMLPPSLGARSPRGACCSRTSRRDRASIGGFYHYANLLLRDATGHGTSDRASRRCSVTGVSMWIAWRDVKISARLMLWIEIVSVS